MHGAIARQFAELPTWIIEPEVSFAVYGERGVIDVLAWHPGRRLLLVVELKTELVDVNDLMGTIDRKRRLAGHAAAERGWTPAGVAAWVVVADGRTNRRRLAGHATVLRTKFPLDGRHIRSWLLDRRSIGRIGPPGRRARRRPRPSRR